MLFASSGNLALFLFFVMFVVVVGVFMTLLYVMMGFFYWLFSKIS
jgi:hypothetical protein